MNERQWELYRWSVVESMPDSPYKAAVLEGIKHRLLMLDLEEASRVAIDLPQPAAAKHARAGH
ncbi:MAG: hypothetical protein ABSB35_15465 [Bryobacteraceae bacterium]